MMLHNIDKNVLLSKCKNMYIKSLRVKLVVFSWIVISFIISAKLFVNLLINLFYKECCNIDLVFCFVTLLISIIVSIKYTAPLRNNILLYNKYLSDNNNIHLVQMIFKNNVCYIYEENAEYIIVDDCNYSYHSYNHKKLK